MEHIDENRCIRKGKKREEGSNEDNEEEHQKRFRKKLN